VSPFLAYTLELDAPLALTASGGGEDEIATLTHIPGSTIRGAVAGRLADPESGPDARRNFDELILDGTVRWLACHPAGPRGLARTVPAPVSWRRPKEVHADENQAPNLYDLAAYGTHAADAWPEEALSGGERWVAPAPVPHAVDVLTDARTHLRRDRRRGTADQESGALYSMESVTATTRFCGLVQVTRDDEELVRRVEEALLAGPLLLGRARHAGYGASARVILAAEAEGHLERQHREIAHDDGRGPLAPAQDLAAGDLARVLLTAPAVVRHPDTGQPDPDAVGYAVLEALGGSGVATLVTRRLASVVVQGFNRRWMTATPAAAAAAAGSIVVIRAERDIPVQDLVAAESGGIGERLAEGYGRIAFLDAPTTRVELQASTPPPAASLPDGAPTPLALNLERRILQSRQERRIADIAASAEVQRLPSRALLGRLRQAARGKSVDAFVREINPSNGALPARASDQLDRCRVTLTGSRSVRLHRLLFDLASGGGAFADETLGRLLGHTELAEAAYLTSQENATKVLNGDLAGTRRRLLCVLLDELLHRQGVPVADPAASVRQAL
jgi:CRISPR-associated protein Csx10